MSDLVSSIRNLGPSIQEACAKIGIHTATQLRDLGADEVYGRLVANGHPPHFIGYYVMVMGLQGRPWNDCKGDEKAALRIKFDAMKATRHDKSRSDFETAMNAIGVIERT